MLSFIPPRACARGLSISGNPRETPENSFNCMQIQQRRAQHLTTIHGYTLLSFRITNLFMFKALHAKRPHFSCEHTAITRQRRSIELSILEVMTSALSGYWRMAVNSEETILPSMLTGRSISGGGIPFDTGASTSGGDIGNLCRS